MNIKIAYLINQYPAVSHTFIRREITELEYMGVEVLRFSVRRPGFLIDDLDRREEEKTKYVLAIGSSKLLWNLLRVSLISPTALLKSALLAIQMARDSDRPWYIHLVYLIEACTILSWCRQCHVNHIHAHFATNPAEVAMLVFSLGGPAYSFTAHGSDIMDRPRLIGLTKTVARAKFVSAVCSFGRAQIMRFTTPRDWKKITVVRCGIDREFTERKLSLPSPAPLTLVCIGRLSAEKGQLVLLEAISILMKRLPEPRLIIVGDGPLRPSLEGAVQQMGLQQVQMLGAGSGATVRAAISESRALVVPSLSEGLPVVIMEAMAMGRPVIAPYLAGIPELVTDGRNGWLYPVGDPNALADAIERCLVASDDVLQRMSLACREDVLLKHNLANEVSKLLYAFKVVAFA